MLNIVLYSSLMFSKGKLLAHLLRMLLLEFLHALSPGHEADDSLPPNVEFNAWNCTSTVPYVFIPHFPFIACNVIGFFKGKVKVFPVLIFN